MSNQEHQNHHEPQDLARVSELTELVRSGANYYRAPPLLRQRIARAVRTQRRSGEPGWLSWRRWVYVGVGFACGALATWLAIVVAVDGDPAAGIEREVIAAHARSLLAAHATDVLSSDQHTVKPWLSARLDFSPPVPDLGADGFSLVGGRLDYIAERPVAAMLYQRHQHLINVFVWPVADRIANTASDATRRAASKGFNILAWKLGGMQYWVVSDLGSEELNALVKLLRQRNADRS